MFTKNEILEALSEQYNVALLNFENNDDLFDESNAVLTSIENIAKKLGLLKELQANA